VHIWLAALERLYGEVERRTNVVGIFPNENAIIRQVGVILAEQNDERAVQRASYMRPETIAPLSGDPIVSLPAVADCQPVPSESVMTSHAPTPRQGTSSASIQEPSAASTGGN
jgi:hypothetical protein